jgi:biotin carboxyl carrier protein
MRFIPQCGMKFHLQMTLPQALWRHNTRIQTPRPVSALCGTRADAAPEKAMPEIKIVTEVAGRVCALPVSVGTDVNDGDDVVFVEAMKMEIPVASPAAGKLKSVLVRIDDIVAEGQVVAIVET